MFNIATHINYMRIFIDIFQSSNYWDETLNFNSIIYSSGIYYILILRKKKQSSYNYFHN